MKIYRSPGTDAWLTNLYRASTSNGKKLNHASFSTYMTLNYDFKKWYEIQPKYCHACGIDDKLTIDHCHQSGRPRGILCSKCNSAEGFLKNPKQALDLANYLIKRDSNG
jgi:hypothetical protein